MTLYNNMFTTGPCRAILILILLYISSNIVTVSAVSSKFLYDSIHLLCKEDHFIHHHLQQQQKTVGTTNDALTSRRIPFQSLQSLYASLSSSPLILRSHDVKSIATSMQQQQQQQQQQLQSIISSCFKQRTKQLAVFGRKNISGRNLFLLRGGDSSSNDEEEEDDDVDTEEDDNEDDEDDDATDSTTTNDSVVTKDNDTDSIVYDEPLYPSKYINMYASMFVMLLGRKYDIFNPIIVRIARYGFILYLVVFQLFLLYARIQVHLNNDRTPVTIDTTSSITNNPLASLVQSQLLGKSDENSTDNDDTTTDKSSSATNGLLKSLASQFLISTTTIYEYDIKQIKSMQGSIVFNIVLMWFLHFKMEQVQPILINTITGFVTLVYSPLFQVYILQRNLQRPYKTIQDNDETTVIDDEDKDTDKNENENAGKDDITSDIDDDTSNDEEEKPIVSEVQEEDEEEDDVNDDNDDGDDDDSED